MELFSVGFLLSAIRAATPLVFCALAVLLAERSGVLHIGVEGSMLIGALTAIVATSVSGSALVGIIITLVIGALIGLFLAGLTVYLPTPQVVVGIAFNLVTVGATSYVFRLTGGLARTTTPAIPTWFLGLSPFSIFAVILTALMWWFLSKTGAGLKLRATGENANAANTAGVDVIKTRARALIVATMLSSLGGAALTIGWVRVFTDNITQGRGFIALAAVYFAKWNPPLALFACLIFGAGEALAFRSQAVGAGISSYYFFMLPYVLTLVAVGLTGRAKGPADCGKIYIRR